ncbi:MAG: TIGR02391 family protein, partial [Ktedonobacteraceae bacterium]
MEHIELTDEQRIYLQRILDYVCANCQWPTHQYLDRSFIQSHPNVDVEDIWKSLPEGLTNYMDINQLDSPATLTIPAIYLLDSNVQVLNTFLQVLKLCVHAWNSDAETPEINSETIIKYYPLWWDKGVYRTGLLLHTEPGIWKSFGGPDNNGNWTCILDRKIRRFQSITTIEEYLEKRDILNPLKVASQPNLHTHSNIKVSSQDLQLHADILTNCWEAYINGKYDYAILNATKAIEVAVRAKAKLPDHIVGADLMAKAFKLDKSLLRYSSRAAEQDGMLALLRGVIQVYKNPQSHRFVGVQNKTECLGVLLMCSNLLYAIE